MVDLRDCGNRALAATTAGPLFDTDGRWDAGDEVHVRTGQLLHELPGISVHRIQEPTLALSEEKIKCQCALAGAANAGHDHESLARDTQREVLQVVLPRAMNGDRLARSALL